MFLGATPSTAGGIIGTAAQQGFAPRWIGQYPSFLGALLESPIAPYMEENYVVAFPFPQWGDETVPGMTTLIEHQQAYAPDQAPDTYFLAGYAVAKSIHAFLEHAVAEGDLSREGVLAALHSLQQIDLDGLAGTYTYG